MVDMAVGEPDLFNRDTGLLERGFDLRHVAAGVDHDGLLAGSGSAACRFFATRQVKVSRTWRGTRPLPLSGLPGNRIRYPQMESPVRQISLVPAPDRRQSETALAIARGTARLLRSLGFSCISELPLPSGRRADLVALNERGEIWIVEIKFSVEDLRAHPQLEDS